MGRGQKNGSNKNRGAENSGVQRAAGRVRGEKMNKTGISIPCAKVQTEERKSKSAYCTEGTETDR